MKQCPKCHAPAVQFGSVHCKSPNCEWLRCSCKAVYHREKELGFKAVRNEPVWHSSQAA
jgi:hypothetical protein